MQLFRFDSIFFPNMWSYGIIRYYMISLADSVEVFASKQIKAGRVPPPNMSSVFLLHNVEGDRGFVFLLHNVEGVEEFIGD